MCRKLETEEEKVLPFGTVPPTPRSKEEDELLQKESNTKLANVVSDYEVRFWHLSTISKLISSNLMASGDDTIRLNWISLLWKLKNVA